MAVTFYPNYTQYAKFDAAAEPTSEGMTHTTSGGETDDPCYDLVDNRRTNVTIFDTDGVGDVWQVRIDLTNAITCNFCIVDNHNLKTATAKYGITQGASLVTPTSQYSGTLGSEMSADDWGSPWVTVGVDGISLARFTSVQDARWDIGFDDAGSNYGADITMGELVFGLSKAPSFNPELQPLFNYDLPGSSFRVSDAGQKYGFSTHSNSQRAWRLTWKYMSDADKADLEFVFLLTGGVKRPFYIDLGDVLGDTNPRLYYVRFMRPLSFTGITKDAWQVTVDIEEEL